MLSVEVIVDPSIGRKLDALRYQSAAMNTKISQVVRNYAFQIVEGAKDLVPISTGMLRRSINATFYDGGFVAIIGSYLPYAARQEFDATLNHAVRPSRRRKENTRAGRKGTVIKGTGQTNPKATWGFLRKTLTSVAPYFLADLRRIALDFGDAWSS